MAALSCCRRRPPSSSYIDIDGAAVSSGHPLHGIDGVGVDLHSDELAQALAAFFDPLDDLPPLESIFDEPTPPPDLLYDIKDDIQSPCFATLPEPPVFSTIPSPPSLPPPYAENIDIARHRAVEDPAAHNILKRPRSCGADQLLTAWRPITPEFAALPPPPAPTNDNNGAMNTMSTRNLSQQSAAARGRRKKISDRTQELVRLIPGGSKMNTAEMFQAAFNYVMFLQAQVAILALALAVDNEDDELQRKQLAVLLASEDVHRKLYGEGLCVVPMETVRELADDPDVVSDPVVSAQLAGFVDSIN